MQITSVIVLVAMDGKQEFRQMLLEEEERKNLVEMINKGALTPNAKALRVLDVPMIRRRKGKTK